MKLQCRHGLGRTSKEDKYVLDHLNIKQKTLRSFRAKTDLVSFERLLFSVTTIIIMTRRAGSSPAQRITSLRDYIPLEEQVKITNAKKQKQNDCF